MLEAIDPQDLRRSIADTMQPLNQCKCSNVACAPARNAKHETLTAIRGTVRWWSGGRQTQAKDCCVPCQAHAVGLSASLVPRFLIGSVVAVVLMAIASAPLGWMLQSHAAVSYIPTALPRMIVGTSLAAFQVRPVCAASVLQNTTQLAWGVGSFPHCLPASPLSGVRVDADILLVSGELLIALVLAAGVVLLRRSIRAETALSEALRPSVASYSVLVSGLPSHTTPQHLRRHFGGMYDAGKLANERRPCRRLPTLQACCPTSIRNRLLPAVAGAVTVQTSEAAPVPNSALRGSWLADLKLVKTSAAQQASALAALASLARHDNAFLAQRAAKQDLLRGGPTEQVQVARAIALAKAPAISKRREALATAVESLVSQGTCQSAAAFITFNSKLSKDRCLADYASSAYGGPLCVTCCQPARLRVLVDSVAVPVVVQAAPAPDEVRWANLTSRPARSARVTAVLTCSAVCLALLAGFASCLLLRPKGSELALVHTNPVQCWWHVPSSAGIRPPLDLASLRYTHVPCAADLHSTSTASLLVLQQRSPALPQPPTHLGNDSLREAFARSISVTSQGDAALLSTAACSQPPLDHLHLLVSLPPPKDAGLPQAAYSAGEGLPWYCRNLAEVHTSGATSDPPSAVFTAPVHDAALLNMQRQVALGFLFGVIACCTPLLLEICSTAEGHISDQASQLSTAARVFLAATAVCIACPVLWNARPTGPFAAFAATAPGTLASLEPRWWAQVAPVIAVACGAHGLLFPLPHLLAGVLRRSQAALAGRHLSRDAVLQSLARPHLPIGAFVGGSLFQVFACSLLVLGFPAVAAVTVAVLAWWLAVWCAMARWTHLGTVQSTALLWSGVPKVLLWLAGVRACWGWWLVSDPAYSVTSLGPTLDLALGSILHSASALGGGVVYELLGRLHSASGLAVVCAWLAWGVWCLSTVIWQHSCGLVMTSNIMQSWCSASMRGCIPRACTCCVQWGDDLDLGERAECHAVLSIGAADGAPPFTGPHFAVPHRFSVSNLAAPVPFDRASRAACCSGSMQGGVMGSKAWMAAPLPQTNGLLPVHFMLWTPSAIEAAASAGALQNRTLVKAGQHIPTWLAAACVGSGSYDMARHPTAWRVAVTLAYMTRCARGRLPFKVTEWRDTLNSHWARLLAQAGVSAVCAANWRTGWQAPSADKPDGSHCSSIHTALPTADTLPAVFSQLKKPRTQLRKASVSDAVVASYEGDGWMARQGAVLALASAETKSHEDRSVMAQPSPSVSPLRREPARYAMSGIQRLKLKQRKGWEAPAGFKAFPFTQSWQTSERETQAEFWTLAQAARKAALQGDASVGEALAPRVVEVDMEPESSPVATPAQHEAHVDEYGSHHEEPLAGEQRDHMIHESGVAGTDHVSATCGRLPAKAGTSMVTVASETAEARLSTMPDSPPSGNGHLVQHLGVVDSGGVGSLDSRPSTGALVSLLHDERREWVTKGIEEGVKSSTQLDEPNRTRALSQDPHTRGRASALLMDERGNIDLEATAHRVKQLKLAAQEAGHGQVALFKGSDDDQIVTEGGHNMVLGGGAVRSEVHASHTSTGDVKLLAVEHKVKVYNQNLTDAVRLEREIKARLTVAGLKPDSAWRPGPVMHSAPDGSSAHPRALESVLKKPYAQQREASRRTELARTRQVWDNWFDLGY